HVGEDGSNYGFSEVALDTFGGIGLGFQAALLSGSGDPADATLGLYTSSAGAGAAFPAPPFGAHRPQRAPRAFNMVNNTLEEFTPPASAFGLEGQTGDVVQIYGGPGSVRAYMRFHDNGSGDNALEVATKAVTDGVVPWVSNGLAADGTGPVSDLLLWNSDTGNAAKVTVTYFPSTPPPAANARVVRPWRRSNRVREAAPMQAQVTLPPGSSSTVTDVLASLFQVSAGSGALVLTSDRPVASAVRLGARKEAGDYATVFGSIDGSQFIPGGTSVQASGFQEVPSVRSTDLVLFNPGGASCATLAGFDANGSEATRVSISPPGGATMRLPPVLHGLRLDGPGSIENARLRVDAPAGSQIYAAAVQTDAVSGDMEWTRPSQ